MAQDDDLHRFKLELRLTDAEANALLRLMKGLETTDVSDILAKALVFQDMCLHASRTGHEVLCRKRDGAEYVIDLSDPGGRVAH